MTDEECIALALLHGCAFEFSGTRYYVRGGPARDADAFEDKHFQQTGYYGAASRADLARAYCKYYGLLEEVT